MLALEYIPGISLYDHIKQSRSAAHLLSALVQIYTPLSEMSTCFAHNDLHPQNILMHRPYPNGHVLYVIHRPRCTPIRMRTTHIASMIDYGRAFFAPSLANSGSARIYKQLCDEPACGSGSGKNGSNGSCGETKGFVAGSLFSRLNASRDTSLLISCIKCLSGHLDSATPANARLTSKFRKLWEQITSRTSVVIVAAILETLVDKFSADMEQSELMMGEEKQVINVYLS
jgi:serine/threonine protein kinase